MNTYLLSALCLLGAWAALVEAVTVQDGDLSFPLESVKKLKDLRALPEPKISSFRKLAPALDKPAAPALCSHPAFPEELSSLCQEPDGEEILQRLETIAQDPSTCEICAYAACTGC